MQPKWLLVYLGALGIMGEMDPLTVVFATTFFLLQDPHFRHQGTTDGVFRCQRYFKCPTGAGLFVSLDKLRCRKNSKLSNTSSGTEQ